MTLLPRALAFSLLAGLCLFCRADETADVSASLEEMAQLLSTGSPCPVGEAQSTPAWKLCVERWERLKTEELYLPIQNANAPAREVSNESAPSEETHQN